MTFTAICAAVKIVDGRPPLVCNLLQDHAGDHGIALVPGGELYVWWQNDKKLDEQRDQAREDRQCTGNDSPTAGPNEVTRA